jgi:hypothetical protein
VCDAVPGDPTAELCGDGIDQDCDGAADDGFDVGTECSAGVGACNNDGHKICAGTTTTCDAVPGDPTDEVCGNQADDDCDGDTDEGFDVGDDCSAGVGACNEDGKKVCAGTTTTCDAVPGEPTDEVCGNSIDDDCDSETDEGFDVGDACEAGEGACHDDGQKICAGTTTVCDAVPGEPGDETCNGLDDDCDGAIDEDLGVEGGEQIDEPIQTDVGQSYVSLVSYAYDNDAGTTQACWQIGSYDHPAVSHYTVGTVAACDADLRTVTINGVAVDLRPSDQNQANQDCAAIHGIKDDKGMAAGELRFLCVVYDGFKELGDISFQAKAGTDSCATDFVLGATCEEIEICPVP